MQVKVRKARDGQWGFLESFGVYNYCGVGNISVTVCITPEGKIAPCYVYRDGEFVPAKEIDDTLGVERYIKAKKPFYCKIADGFIATIKAGYNFTEKKFLKDKTSFYIYTVNQAFSPDLSGDKGSLSLEKILSLPSDITELMYRVAEVICLCDGDRCDFIKNRF